MLGIGFIARDWRFGIAVLFTVTQLIKVIASSTDAAKELWMELLEKGMKFGPDSSSQSDSKSESIVTGPNVAILDALGEVDTAKASVQTLSADDWEERRKKLKAAMGGRRVKALQKQRLLYERQGMTVY